MVARMAGDLFIARGRSRGLVADRPPSIGPGFGAMEARALGGGPWRTMRGWEPLAALGAARSADRRSPHWEAEVTLGLALVRP